MFWATKVHTDNVKCTVYYAVIAHWALDACICCVFAFLMFALLCIGRIHEQQTVCSVPEHWALRAASGQLVGS